MISGLSHVMIITDAVAIDSGGTVAIGPDVWVFFAPLVVSGGWHIDPWETFSSQPV
jgi:hypothetical protein